MSLYCNLRKKLVEEAKKVGDPKVPNMKEPLVEVCVQGETKRKMMKLVSRGVGKDMKRVSVELLHKELKEGVRRRLRKWPKNLHCYRPNMRRKRRHRKKEKQELVVEKKHLSSWKLRCLNSEKKFKEKVKDLLVDNEELKEKYEGI